MRRKITESLDELANEYIEFKGTRCPYCRSYNIEGLESPDFCGGATISQLCHCLDCLREWSDVYDLTSVCLSEDETEVVEDDSSEKETANDEPEQEHEGEP